MLSQPYLLLLFICFFIEITFNLKEKLKKEFKDDVAVLYHDNYYRDQSDIPLEERRKTNYDHPDAMETELLIRKLMN